MFKFERPDNVLFPSVYYNFFSKDKNSDHVIEYRVQDLPEEHYERALELMVKHFLPDETLCSNKNSSNNPEIVQPMLDFWRLALKEKSSIGCYRNNDENNELVGVNVFIVKSINDPEDTTTYTNDDVNDIFGVLSYTMKQIDVYAKYNVDQYLAAFGLCIDPDYRGRGIATEMLKARVPILRSFGLNVTVTSFTGVGSQLAAKKAGYEDIYSISYADLEKIFPRFDFSKNVTKFFKIMALQLVGDTI